MNERRKPNLTADPAVAGRTHTNFSSAEFGMRNAEWGRTPCLGQFKVCWGICGGRARLCQVVLGGCRRSEGRVHSPQSTVQGPQSVRSAFAGGFDATFCLRCASAFAKATARQVGATWDGPLGQVSVFGAFWSLLEVFGGFRRGDIRTPVQCSNGSRVEGRTSRHGATRFLAAGRRRNSQLGRLRYNSQPSTGLRGRSAFAGGFDATFRLRCASAFAKATARQVGATWDDPIGQVSVFGSFRSLSEVFGGFRRVIYAHQFNAHPPSSDFGATRSLQRRRARSDAPYPVAWSKRANWGTESKCVQVRPTGNPVHPSSPRLRRDFPSSSDYEQNPVFPAFP
jgi:hypothetical protein